MRNSNERSIRHGVGEIIPAVMIFMTAAWAMGAAAPHRIEKISDHDITQAVTRSLLDNPSAPAHDIQVVTDNGVVTLSGSVDNIRSRRAAVTIAEAIKGVRSVVNEIKVVPHFRDDKAVRSDIEFAIMAKPALRKRAITVSVKGGQVSLRGTVQSFEEQELASYAAEGIAGVVRVDNELGIDFATKRSDDDIRADVIARILHDTLVDGTFIDVTVANGKVTLGGIVGSAAERRQAIRDAWVNGTRAVIAKDISVEVWDRTKEARHRMPVPNDSEIKKAIIRALDYDRRDGDLSPDIEVKDAVVTLAGAADTLAAKWAAAEDAQNTVGVLRVISLIKVEPVGRLPDERLFERVRAAIQRDPELNRYPVTATVSNGKAFLFGNVPSYYDVALADHVVAHVSGIMAIENNILVTPPKKLKQDWEIQSDIDDALFWSPFVDADRITVGVHDGVATLSGKVDTWTQRSIAEHKAWENGARRVVDRLEFESWE